MCRVIHVFVQWTIFSMGDPKKKRNIPLSEEMIPLTIKCHVIYYASNFQFYSKLFVA